ncbi:hypothetical protein E8E13_011376 [Curvularia kusanoi]|uniref:Uncharacterized protein n=1 Tax=Curvularia kusanoi TaxID=90978 RepID=A0A9P4TKY2_CURKU|nr:hypothetical protein E8E13_011376 [Curvularia kusanoi]
MVFVETHGTALRAALSAQRSPLTSAGADDNDENDTGAIWRPALSVMHKYSKPMTPEFGVSFGGGEPSARNHDANQASL